jgi:DNA-binding NarL/FixJ family response regulator
LPPIRVLVVEDNRDWRKLVRLLLQMRPEWQVICEASDGLEGVQKADELKPDLILLDIGLPKLNGIEAARQIQRLSPNSKIVFVSMDNSLDVVQEALSTGAQGYVYKSSAQSDLPPAIDAALRGERFVSSEIEGYKLTDIPDQRAPHRHEVQFYSDDAVFLDRCTRFIAAALGAGDVVAVVATESHRDSLFHQVKVEGLDVDGEIKHGRYISLDVAQTLSTFMVNGMPDWERFFEVVGGLVSAGAKAGKKEHSRVAICGECGPFLWAEGKVDAAMRLEHFLNQLATIYQFDLLCAYPLNSFHGEEHEREFQSICAAHSAVFSA